MREQASVQFRGILRNIKALYSRIIISVSCIARQKKARSTLYPVDGINPARVLCNLSFTGAKAETRACVRAFVYVCVCVCLCGRIMDMGACTRADTRDSRTLRRRRRRRRQSTFNGAHFIFMPDYL